ncbi:hypothetical protein BA896_012745 [Janthinobacterium lividum]|uniref:Uncharacterized protein n=1 Tax=Janthinobacterium lividum TaxID=29581 RepID=A0A1E8PTS9_9BURK|nr:hypothetical protein BA896_012745 [Janthinobacterium lividum]
MAFAERNRQDCVLVRRRAAQLGLGDGRIQALHLVAQHQVDRLAAGTADVINDAVKYQAEVGARPAWVASPCLDGTVAPHIEQPAIKRAIAVVQLDVAARQASFTRQADLFREGKATGGQWQILGVGRHLGRAGDVRPRGDKARHLTAGHVHLGLDQHHADGGRALQPF